MAWTVTWSPTAKLSYYQILEYLHEKWTQKELEAFINRTEEVLAVSAITRCYILIQKRAIHINVF